jgi:hypothetical protein|tara:strand:+ start:243 stop:1940 length:1698 start_codon:yes stop_codon:yes gene_type:complete
MSFQPSRTETIKTLFHGNRFVIPAYQRKYSWKFDQRKALWDDINENLNMSHFIGTLCFQKNEKAGDIINDVYDVIDGQQRITTLYILLNVLIEKVTSDNKIAYITLFIGKEDQPKLIPLGSDTDFMKKVIYDFESIDIELIKIRSQKQLYNAKREFASMLEGKTQKEIENYISYVSKEIEILIFNVTDQAQAVKMFSVINDRGLPLSNLDKTKSALMMYSTIYLDCKLNDSINENFGKIFDLLDNVLDRKEELRIFRTLDDIDFENTFFTHHYYSAKHLFSDWDYQLGALSIFKQIKRKCEQEKMNIETLEEFIKNYIKDFYNFSKAYSELFDKIARDDKYSKLFQFLEFTATLYPLIVRLNEQGKLDGLLSILELAEVRVYKLKNTNPRRNMYILASEINETDFSEKEIEEKIREFVTNFLNDYQLESYMNEGVDNKTALVRYLLYDYNKSNNNQDLSLNDYRNLQVEHVFSVNPNFNTETYGFERVEIYSKKISLIGNLSILEKGLNSKVGNICPTDKVNGYQESKLQINSHLMANLDKFNQEYIEKRNLKLVEYTKTRFNLN